MRASSNLFGETTHLAHFLALGSPHGFRFNTLSFVLSLTSNQKFKYPQQHKRLDNRRKYFELCHLIFGYEENRKKQTIERKRPPSKQWQI